MNFDTIGVIIRPRNPWEAIDIGFILARGWYRKLLLLWLLTGIPLLILFTGIGLILPGHEPKWGLLLFWFFKPLCEAPLLIWISRALFGPRHSLKQSIEAASKNIPLKRLWPITLHRFTPYRSFSLPVLLLEGLEGKDRRERVTLLKDGYETSALLTIVGFCIETVLALSLMSILYWFIPDELRWVDFGRFIFRPDKWLLMISYFVACSVFAPFYVSAGFMMYISRRVELEAWDIEIGFKKVRQRLQKRKNGIVHTAAALGLPVVFCLSLFPGTGWCMPRDPDTAQATVTKVLEQREFGEKITRYNWVFKDKDTPETNSAWAEFLEKIFDTMSGFVEKFSPLVARYGEFFLWGCAGILIFFLLLKYSHIRAWLAETFAPPPTTPSRPEILFGMDIRPKSLPNDIARTCYQLLAEGKKREAMSLLYRGTLSRLINGYKLDIHSSYTEDECCAKAQKNLPQPEATYFRNLTSLWVYIAYGHRDPDSDKCFKLVDRWETLYGVQQ